MALTFADRVSETTTTTGLGSVSLGGATDRHQTFAVGIGNGNQCAYCIEAQSGSDWEVGYGIVTVGAPSTLSRDTILSSSNNGLKVNFPAGTKNVFCVVPAAVISPLGPTLGGTGVSTYILGDSLYASAANTLAVLAGNITTTKKFLRQTGTGAVSAAPAWDTVVKGDVGLGNVENTALSTWAGSINLTTLGTIGTGVWQGTKVNLAYGGTNADLSATGGASQVLKQASAGAAITVAQLAASDLSNGVTGSGAVALATSPTFTTSLIATAGLVIKPTADSTTALQLAQADGTVFGNVNTTNKRITIGHTGEFYTQGRLLVAGEDGNAEMYAVRASADSAGPVYGLLKARGSLASLADAQNGDTVGTFAFQARSGGSFFNGAIVTGEVDGTFTSGQRPPSRLTFQTNLAGVSQIARLTVLSNGNIGIGTITQINELLTLDNAGWLGAKNAAGNSSQKIISLNASNLIAFGAARSAASVAANFSADFYIRFQDVNGAEFYIPAKNANW